MGAFVANSAFTGGYVGTTPVDALYLGTDLIWASPTSGYTFYPDNGVTSLNEGAATGVIDVQPTLPDVHIRVKGHHYPANVFGTKTGADMLKSMSAPNRIQMKMSNVQSPIYSKTIITQMGDGEEVMMCSTCSTSVDWSDADFDWTIYPNGLYNNTTRRWIETGTTASNLSNSSLDVYFEYVVWKEIQVWQDSVKVFDGIAAERKSDGQGGLFDRVSNTFITDENTAIYVYQP